MEDIAATVHHQLTHETPAGVVKYVVFTAWHQWHLDSKALRILLDKRKAEYAHKQHGGRYGLQLDMARMRKPPPEWVSRLAQSPRWQQGEIREKRRQSLLLSSISIF